MVHFINEATFFLNLRQKLVSLRHLLFLWRQERPVTVCTCTGIWAQQTPDGTLSAGFWIRGRFCLCVTFGSRATASQLVYFSSGPRPWPQRVGSRQPASESQGVLWVRDRQARLRSSSCRLGALRMPPAFCLPFGILLYYVLFHISSYRGSYGSLGVPQLQ